MFRVRSCLRAAALIATCLLAGPSIAAQASAPHGNAQKCKEGEVFDVVTGGCEAVSGENVPQLKAQKDKPFLVVPRKIPTSGTPYELHLVETRDEIYVPVGVRKPAGKGPFPAILVGRGNGYDGFGKIEKVLYELEPMMDEMLERGYVVAFANYRNEIPQQYNAAERARNLDDDISGGGRTLKSTATLDSDDFVSLIEHLQALPYVRDEDVGTVGVSHAGELQAKAAAEITWGAGVLIEGASYEFIAVDVDKAPRKDDVMHLEDPAFVKSISDKPKAMARIRRMQTPFLHLGREKDHLQGVFRTLHDWMIEAGHKNSTWRSVDHDVHGYGFYHREEMVRNKDGSYVPDPAQKQSFEEWMSFFDKHLKNAKAAAVSR